MAFSQSTFAPFGPQAANTPKIYSYESTDVLAQAITAGYFEDKKYQLEKSDWILCVLGDGNALLQVLTDTASVVQVSLSGLPTDNYTGGFFDYNDLTTQSTAISVTGGAGFVNITNDEAGPNTNKLFPPTGITDVWDSTAMEFDWTQLKLGDMVDIRVDLTVTTTSPNQTIDLRLFLGVGGSEYSIPFEEAIVKSSGTFIVNRFNGIYMGDTNTLNNPGEFRIASDGNATVVVTGWYCKIIKRGG